MIIVVGMSLRGRSVENKILLDGNFVEASVIIIKMFETSSSGELALSSSFVPVHEDHLGRSANLIL